MEPDHQEQVALHRWAVIAEATSDRLSPQERGAVVRQIAAGTHASPDGSDRRYSRATIDRWIRAWRSGGLDALKPTQRADTGAVRAHPELFGEAAPHATMKDVFEAVMPYIEDQLAHGTRLHSVTRHFVGAFHGVPGARAFRRHLAENGVKPGAGVNVLRDAIALVEDRVVAALAA